MCIVFGFLPSTERDIYTNYRTQLYFLSCLDGVMLYHIAGSHVLSQRREQGTDISKWLGPTLGCVLLPYLFISLDSFFLSLSFSLAFFFSLPQHSITLHNVSTMYSITLSMLFIAP